MPLTSEFADLGPEFSQSIKLSLLESPKLVHWNSSAAQLIGLETLPENILALLNGIEPMAQIAIDKARESDYSEIDE